MLSISHLYFTYPRYEDTGEGHEPLFRDLNLRLAPGSLTVIAGVPDSGKTSLARIICGMTPRYSGGELSGDIFVGETDISDHRPQDLMERLGTVFQNPDEQLLTTRVDSEIAFPLEALGLPREEIDRRLQKALDDFALRDKAGRNPASLSGGEKKRLLCAVLAATEPALWVMDETIDEIDREWQHRILDMLRELGTTVLLLSSKFLKIHREFSADLRLLAGGSLIDDDEKVRTGAVREGLVLPDIPPYENPQKEPSGRILLRVEDLTFRYPGNEDFALQADSLELREGEVLSLAGPNGCGKTSLAKLLCGLLEASRGRIDLFTEDGKKAVSGNPNSLRTSVAYIFQNPDYQIFLPTVREELAFGLKELGTARDLVEERVHQAVELFHLPSLDSSPSMMSYGARKRLQAATYWLLERRVCILDEADSGLSLRDFAEIIGLFRSTHRGIIIITHNEELARRFSDRVAVMQEGRLL